MASTMTRRERLAQELYQYAREGTDTRYRARCKSAAKNIEAGCDLIGLRDQLTAETANGDMSTVAKLIVTHAISEDAHLDPIPRTISEAESRLNVPVSQDLKRSYHTRLINAEARVRQLAHTYQDARDTNMEEQAYTQYHAAIDTKEALRQIERAITGHDALEALVRLYTAWKGEAFGEAEHLYHDAYMCVRWDIERTFYVLDTGN